jgi:hypothetical protein
MAGKPNKERVSYEGRRSLNSHYYRHHAGAPKFTGDLASRLEQHDELHFQARKNGVDLGHTHLPYQDGETDNQMAARMLAEGTEQSSE